MNWGYKIAGVFILFVILIVGLVAFCMRQDDIFLVTENYYEKEINYRDQMNIEQNTADLDVKPKVKYNKEEQSYTLNFSGLKEDDITGTILFFRPADAGKDFKKEISLDSLGTQKILTGNMDKGLWKVKIQWTMGDKEYYMEERLVVS